MTAWTPPDDPDPSEILNGARADTRGGQHARALAKFLWFHHNALRHRPSLTGVRLSFALVYWTELAKVYPPAREAFVRTRDEVEAAFAAEPKRFGLFCELSALNRYLGHGVRTADAFARAVQANPSAAQRLYDVAEPSLIAAGRYEACGPFLDPPAQLTRAAESYRTLSEWEAESDSDDEPRPPKLARPFFVRDAATLIGLLVLNRRPDEATRTRDEALTVIDDADFRATLDAALTGHLHPPLFEAGS